MRTAAVWMAAALSVDLGAGPARAAFDTPPQWIKGPDADAMAAAFPGVAASLEIGGQATLRCAVGLDQRARDCAVIAETPAGLGFGAAALAIAPAFRLRPAKAGGRPVDGAQVNIPVRFQIPPDKLLAQGKGYRPPKSTEDQKALARRVVAQVVPAAWLTAKVTAFVTQTLPAAPGAGETPDLLADARRANDEAIAAGLASMQEATALELAARRPGKVLQQALDAPPSDPGAFLDAQFKGVPPAWVLAEVARIKADARARFCRARGCGG